MASDIFPVFSTAGHYQVYMFDCYSCYMECGYVYSVEDDSVEFVTKYHVSTEIAFLSNIFLLSVDSAIVVANLS